MIGIWAVTVWEALGRPPALRLVELGPGRGTLMADALRGTAPLSAFARALSVHFVEVSSADAGHLHAKPLNRSMTAGRCGAWAAGLPGGCVLINRFRRKIGGRVPPGAATVC